MITPSPLDWNWFFSSLAQSAAAIVGIFGAFVITKILSNQAAFDNKKNHMRELIANAINIKNDASDLSIDRYNNLIADREKIVLERLLDRHSGETAEQLHEKCHFSDFMEKSEALRIIVDIMQVRQEREARDREEMAGLLGTELMQRNSTFIKPVSLQIDLPNRALEKKHAAIKAVLKNARHHIRPARDCFLSVQGNPESSPEINQTLGMVAMLFYVGVILPLLFLPIRPDSLPLLQTVPFFDIAFSLKGLLLIAVSAIFSWILAIFFLMNIRMKYKEEEVQELRKFSSLGSYSKFFLVMESNQKDGGT